MSTNASAALKTAANDDIESAYTYHIEPATQGGCRYVRCETCGAECVPATPARLTHRPGCTEADA
ncbi:hypothetical protein J2752_000462 [Halarchaeum rubridurum]|uniref:DUF8118 domain-containing protein n=1 Tax=Halarchaeum rubridurum TaxID=489911 RepID=A0A830FYV5_9EURY|nr:hypothetical protein [Halarchaeum rubridurum]MBP1953581.1 hypothetical protein [Halarchaeum rubridurum]GGM64222.1 hypothetical protein GCM10009017_12820 [Halarchaeum rubridurum]